MIITVFISLLRQILEYHLKNITHSSPPCPTLSTNHSLRDIQTSNICAVNNIPINKEMRMPTVSSAVTLLRRSGRPRDIRLVTAWTTGSQIRISMEAWADISSCADKSSTFSVWSSQCHKMWQPKRGINVNSVQRREEWKTNRIKFSIYIRSVLYCTGLYTEKFWWTSWVTGGWRDRV